MNNKSLSALESTGQLVPIERMGRCSVTSAQIEWGDVVSLQRRQSILFVC